jgi:hypothetical protein
MAADPTIGKMESLIISRGYKINKVYDGDKGICTVTLVSKDGFTKISDKNRSRASFSDAYRTSLAFVWNAIRDLEITRERESKLL